MKIRCIHGYFIIEEDSTGEVARFMSLYNGIEIVSKGQYFTFSPLLEAFELSIKGTSYVGATSTKTFSGKPWEVMKANGLVYNFNTGKMVLLESITDRAMINRASDYFWTEGLLLPGSLNEQGLRVLDYVAGYDFRGNKFKLAEVTLG